jgi:hypothetical protein
MPVSPSGGESLTPPARGQLAMGRIALTIDIVGLFPPSVEGWFTISGYG